MTLRARAVAVAEQVLARADRRLHPYWRHTIRLDHPPAADGAPRYGYGRPPHRGIAEYLGAHEAAYATELRRIVALTDDLARIPATADDVAEPCWVNPWLLGLDTASLYSVVRHRRPAQYVEVGSGQSTLVVDRARRDGAVDVEITSVDPSPRAEIDRVCDAVVRTPLERADLGRVFGVRAGDVVFFDGSHRLFTGSDVAVFYLEVLPALPPGVVVGIHDVLWPDDYLPEWSTYWFSEQYLLGAWILGGAARMEPLLACNYVAAHPQLRTLVDPLWSALGHPALDRRGFTFWFEVSDR